MKTIFITVVLLITSIADAQTNIQWRHGLGQCYGKWGYLRYNLCQSEMHPLVEIWGENNSDSRCPVEEATPIYEACRDSHHPVEKWDKVKEWSKKGVELNYASNSKIQQLCNAKLGTIGQGQRGTASYSDVNRFQECGFGLTPIPDPGTEPCPNLGWVTKYKCNLLIEKATYKKVADSYCNQIGTDYKYENCLIESYRKSLRTEYCSFENPSEAIRLDLGKHVYDFPHNSTNTPENGLALPTLVCTTGDDLPASNRDELQTKFESLQDIVEDRNTVFPESILSDVEIEEINYIFETIIVDYDKWLDDTQLFWTYNHLLASFKSSSFAPSSVASFQATKMIQTRLGITSEFKDLGEEQ